jgi:hypothetical protein
VIYTQIYNTQYQSRNTDYWADDALGRLLVSEGFIRPVVSVSVLTLWIRYLRVYHWVDTSAGRLLVSEGIIRPVVSVSDIIHIISTETLTTGRMMPSETNSLPAEVSTQ